MINNLDTFYTSPIELSYSSMKLLLFDPMSFKKKYIDREYPEKTSKNMIEGRVIHCLLLRPEDFDKQYIISPSRIPNTVNKTIIDSIYKGVSSNDTMGTLHSYTEEILYSLKEEFLHQSLKTDEQRINKILTGENISYFDYLRSRGSRDIIDQETYDRCLRAVDKLKSSEGIRELMNGDFTANELELHMTLNNVSFGLKGVLDNLVVDHDDAIVRINDIKTTSGSLEEFPEGVQFYKYWLQAVIYWYLASNWGKKENLIHYKIEINFIVIDSYGRVYVFPVKKETLLDWKIRAEKCFLEADYHISNRDFNLPYAFAKKMVKL